PVNHEVDDTNDTSNIPSEIRDDPPPSATHIFAENITGSANVELVTGSGMFLSKSKIAAAKLGSRSPTILARNLFRYLFAPKELAGHSLMGRS
ncbi:unnamed protein product, partial [Allacma fusca]